MFGGDGRSSFPNATIIGAMGEFRGFGSRGAPSLSAGVEDVGKLLHWCAQPILWCCRIRQSVGIEKTVDLIIGTFA